MSNLKLRKKFQNSQSQDEVLKPHSQSPTQTHNYGLFLYAQETALKKDLDKLTGGNPTKCKLLVSALLPIAFFIGIGGVFIHLQEDIDFVSALYFATATCTTIGWLSRYVLLLLLSWHVYSVSCRLRRSSLLLVLHFTKSRMALRTFFLPL